MTIYQGQLDLICCTLGVETWLQRLKWPGMVAFNAAPHEPFYAHGHDHSTAGFSRRHQNLAMYYVMSAGALRYPLPCSVLSSCHCVATSCQRQTLCCKAPAGSHRTCVRIPRAYVVSVRTLPWPARIVVSSQYLACWPEPVCLLSGRAHGSGGPACRRAAHAHAADGRRRGRSVRGAAQHSTTQPRRRSACRRDCAIGTPATEERQCRVLSAARGLPIAAA